VPTEARELIQQFQQDREAFIQQQKQLADQLKTSTAEQRAVIREQMKALIDDWRAKQQEYARQWRQNAVDLGRELRDHQRPIGAGAATGGATNRVPTVRGRVGR
jgi:gas vesicle protein